MGERKGQSRWLWLASGALLLALGAVYAAFPAVQEEARQGVSVLASGDRERIAEWASGYDPWGPVVIVVAMVIQMFLVIVPSYALIAVSVLAYGPGWGSALALLAVLTASAIGYGIGVLLAPHVVDRLVGPSTRDRVEHYADRYGLWAVIVFRLSPFLSNDAISFVGGLVRMGAGRFLAATAIGVSPLIALIAYLGTETDSMITGLAWAGGISLALFVVYVALDQRRLARARRAPESAAS